MNTTESVMVPQTMSDGDCGINSENNQTPLNEINAPTPDLDMHIDEFSSPEQTIINHCTLDLSSLFQKPLIIPSPQPETESDGNLSTMLSSIHSIASNQHSVASDILDT